MGNVVAVLRTLLHGLMEMAGMRLHMVEIEPGTVMSFWVPKEIIKKPKKPDQKEPVLKVKPSKPVVVLVHGFAADGILTWQFQVGALTKKYAVYVPDLLFFGGSITDKQDRSPTFQAECLATGLRKLGVEECTVVGFSYGGMVAFKMAELYPEMVRAMVISGSMPAMTDSIMMTTMTGLGFSSSAEFLLPTSVKGLKACFSAAAYKKLRLPDRFYRDYLEVMFNNRKEKGELLEGLVIRDKDSNNLKFSQRIQLLWGENDDIFKVEPARNLKDELGNNAIFERIKKAGHLVHLERPYAYNRCLKQFLSSL